MTPVATVWVHCSHWDARKVVAAASYDHMASGIVLLKQDHAVIGRAQR